MTPSDPGGSGGAVLDALDAALLVASALEGIGCDYFISFFLARGSRPRHLEEISALLRP